MGLSISTHSDSAGIKVALAAVNRVGLKWEADIPSDKLFAADFEKAPTADGQGSRP